MEGRGYGILEFEAIWDMARELVYSFLLEGMTLDDEGNYIGYPDNFTEWKEKRNIDLRFKYLNFRECKELHSITIAEASELTCHEIMEKYLFEAIPLIRSAMRKGSLTPYQFVKDEVPDEYLNQIICIAWKADLMIWASSWDRERKKLEMECKEDSTDDEE